MNVAPEPELVGRFKTASGGKPAQGGAKVAFAPTKEEGWDHAFQLWPNAGLIGDLPQILPTPEHFEQATELVTRQMIQDSTVAGNDLAEHLEQVQQYADAGYDELYIANMGLHHKEMIAVYGEQVLPKLD